MRGQDRSGRMRMRRSTCCARRVALLFAGTAAVAQTAIGADRAERRRWRRCPRSRVPKWIIDDVRQMRAYPEQPPVIPHSIDGYQLSVNTNRCLSCHKREFTEGSGAPMISVTHFMTRDGQMLADVSPRRLFLHRLPRPAGKRPSARRKPLQGHERARRQARRKRVGLCND